MAVKDVLYRMRKLRAALVNPVEFFHKNLGPWRDLAKQTAVTILTANRPPDTEPEVWAHQVENTAVLITTHLTGADLFETAGMMIYLGERQNRSFSSVIMAAMTNNLSLEDIADYVAAGMRGDPLGKHDIDERDQGKTPEQVAMTISRSIEQGNAEREQAVRSFLAGRASAEIQALYEAILKAWVEVFSVRAVDDWRAYIRELAKG